MVRKLSDIIPFGYDMDKHYPRHKNYIKALDYVNKYRRYRRPIYSIFDDLKRGSAKNFNKLYTKKGKFKFPNKEISERLNLK